MIDKLKLLLTNNNVFLFLFFITTVRLLFSNSIVHALSILIIGSGIILNNFLNKHENKELKQKEQEIENLKVQVLKMSEGKLKKPSSFTF